MMIKTCEDCIWFEAFIKRPDEPSDMGCKERNWGGYIGNPLLPPCGGIKYSRKEKITCESLP